jgi:nucleoside-diphosphate-sugar epimerase
MPTSSGLVAVSGATGHIGANLSRALLQQGRALRLLVREDVRAVAGLPVERGWGAPVGPPGRGPARGGGGPLKGRRRRGPG